MNLLKEDILRIKEIMQIDDEVEEVDTEEVETDEIDEENIDGEIDEQEEGGESSSSPMGKWETGLTRGPANQLGATKWSDSYQPSRGKANPLW
jgi:hypothetical protein